MPTPPLRGVSVSASFVTGWKKDAILEHSPISLLEGLKGKLISLHQSNEENALLLADVLSSLDSLSGVDTLSPLAFARRVHRTRMRAREIIGPAIVRDPKWEMLLELYVAHHEHRRVSVSALCHAANAPATTSLRHIEALERLGFFHRIDDPMDARRSWIEPTSKALDGVGAILRDMQRAA